MVCDISYKVSNYTCFFSLKEKLYLIYNTFNNNILKVDRGSFLQLQEMQISGDVKSIFDENFFDKLVNLGILVEENVDEYLKVFEQFNKKRFKKDKLFLTIAPTLDCNFGCPYCYEISKKSYMDLETENHILDFVANQIGRIKSISVVLIGGEPLLNKQTVFRLTKEIGELAKSKSVSTNFSLITNGYLLDKETVDRLWELGLNNVQITLDGDETTHNKRRFLKKAKTGTFKKIVENLKYCSEKIENVTVRVNVDKTNKDSWLQVKKTLTDLGIYSKIKLNVGMVDAVNDHNLKSIDKCLTVSEFAKIKSDFIFDDDRVNSKKLKLPSMPVCSAVRTNSFSIDAKGFLYKCWNHIGFKEKSCGHISQAFNLNENYNEWINFSLDKYEECKSCSVLPICMGNCPDRLEKFGTGEQVCTYYKDNLREYVLLYYLSKKQKPHS